jgi:hypothetical protein
LKGSAVILLFSIGTLAAAGGELYVYEPRIGTGGGESFGGAFRVNGHVPVISGIAGGGPFSLQAHSSGIGIVLQNPEAPFLRLAQGEKQFLLSWRATTSAFSVETTADLRSPVRWNLLSVSVTTANGTNTVALPIAPGQSFFRLQRQ